MNRLPSIEVNERIAVDGQLSELTQSLGQCEKLLRTPIPLGYTRYAVRFLWIWLSLLPFALVRTFGDFGQSTWWADKPQALLPFTMLLLGFIFLSIEDIAVQIEEPFAILPLELHTRWLDRDAEQTRWRSSASAARRPEPAAARCCALAASARSTNCRE